jgi:hypothetical protein
MPGFLFFQIPYVYGFLRSTAGGGIVKGYYRDTDFWSACQDSISTNSIFPCATFFFWYQA